MVAGQLASTTGASNTDDDLPLVCGITARRDLIANLGRIVLFEVACSRFAYHLQIFLCHSRRHPWMIAQLPRLDFVGFFVTILLEF